jgi:hypothetical protein
VRGSPHHAGLEGDGNQPDIAWPRATARSARPPIFDGILPMATGDRRHVTLVALHAPQDAPAVDGATSPEWITWS